MQQNIGEEKIGILPKTDRHVIIKTNDSNRAKEELGFFILGLDHIYHLRYTSQFMLSFVNIISRPFLDDHFFEFALLHRDVLQLRKERQVKTGMKDFG